MDKHKKHTMTCVTWECIMFTVCYDCSKEQKWKKQKAGKSLGTSEAAEVGGQHSALKSEGMADMQAVTLKSRKAIFLSLLSQFFFKFSCQIRTKNTSFDCWAANVPAS